MKQGMCDVVLLCAVIAVGPPGCGGDRGGNSEGVEESETRSPGVLDLSLIEVVAEIAAGPEVVSVDLHHDLLADEATVTVAPGSVLLLDLEMRHPVSWKFLVETLEAMGHEVLYRRWYPHITAADVKGEDGTPVHSIIVVSSGNAPGEPSDRMRPGDADNLVAHVNAGGSVLLLNRHTWLDGYGGDTDWLFFNRFLEAAGVPVRVARNTAVGFVSQSWDGKPPLHQQVPAAYAGSLEWSLSYPTCHTDPSHPVWGSAEFAYAGGVTSTISCDGDDVAVLGWTHQNVLLWNWLDNNNPDAVNIPLEAQPVAVISPAGEAGGFVGVLPRSVAQMPIHTEYMSDKPILDLGLLDNTETFAAGFLEHLSALAADPEAHAPQGCHATTLGGLFSAAGDGLEPLGGGDVVQAQFPPSHTPVPEAPPEPPEGAPALFDAPAAGEPIETATPSWYRQGRARLGYGGLRPYGEMVAFFEKSIGAGIDSFVVTIDSQSLIDYHQGGATEPPVFVELAQAASDTGANLFLGVNFLTGVYGANKEVVGQAQGAYGQVLEAPAPLSDFYWENSMEATFLGAAKAAKAYPGIMGVHMDMELYGAGSLWYAQGYSFDDDTFGRMSTSLGEVSAALAEEAAALEPYERQEWLVEHGLAAHAYLALEQETAARCASLRMKTREIRPELELAFYGVQVSTAWFYKGLMKGLGTSERPVTHLSYDIATNRAREVFEAEGIAVRIIGGDLGIRFTPVDLEASLYNAGLRSDGYWLFQFTDFPVQWDPDSPPPMHGTPDEYWEAVTTANALLDAVEPPHVEPWP